MQIYYAADKKEWTRTHPPWQTDISPPKIIMF